MGVIEIDEMYKGKLVNPFGSYYCIFSYIAMILTVYGKKKKKKKKTCSLDL
jgi:hypothetical protein